AGSGIHAAVIHVGPIDTEIWHKTDEPTAYRGRKLPPSSVSRAILRAIEARRHEVWVPGALRLAWWFRLLAPRLFRWGSARFDPVPADVVAAARERAGPADWTARRGPGRVRRRAPRALRPPRASRTALGDTSGGTTPRAGCTPRRVHRRRTRRRGPGARDRRQGRHAARATGAALVLAQRHHPASHGPLRRREGRA